MRQQRLLEVNSVEASGAVSPLHISVMLIDGGDFIRLPMPV